MSVENEVFWWLLSFFSFFICIYLSQYLWSKRKFYYLSWQMPGPLAFPLIGNAFNLTCNIEDILEVTFKLIHSYPSPFRFWIGPKFVFVISDVTNAEKVMSSMKFSTKDEVYKYIKVFTGEGLITASGAKWKSDRKLLGGLFLRKNIIPFYPIFLEQANILSKKLEDRIDQGIFNIEPILHRCAFDICSEAVAGTKSSAQDGNLNELLEYLKLMYIIAHAHIAKPWLHLNWFYRQTHFYRDQEAGKTVIYNYMRMAIKNVRQDRLNGGPKNHPSFLHDMIEIQETNPGFADDLELIHHLCTLFSASEDTVSIICSFTLVVLGMYPDIQNRVLREIQEILEDRDPELSDIEKFIYLDMCIKDVLRLFPIAPYIMRVTLEDCQIDKYRVPEGCTILVSIHSIHRDPKLWDTPDEFNPDHFLHEKVTNRKPYSFMPFSAGPRGCTGKTYAYIAMKVILIQVLRKYNFQSKGKLQDKKLRADISTRFKDDFYPVQITKR